MCRLMHRFWAAQEFAFFQLEGLFKSPVEISSKSMLGFSASHHTSNHWLVCMQTYPSFSSLHKSSRFYGLTNVVF